MSKSLVIVYSLLAFLALPALARPRQPQVKLGKTTVFGDDLSEKVEFFGGIPYAEPPVGPLRLSPPILKARLDAPTFNASAFGKACVQPYLDPALVSEDCLTINVYRPAGVSPQKKLPVLFWTYGGAMVIGSSNEWLYNATNLVARGVDRGTPVVYVSFNYRVGPLGFPQGQEADDRRALNLGVLDQRTALQWVHENIHFFGGDRDKVTMFGESAGAILTATQLLDPQVEKLARAAILESGSPNSLRSWSAARNEAGWQDFVSSVASCANLKSTSRHRTFDCLKLAPASEIVEAVNKVVDLAQDLPWGVTLDRGEGSVFPEYPSVLYEEGRFARIPLIVGTNLDEGTPIASLHEATEPDLRLWILKQHAPPTVSQAKLEEVTDRILELYPDDPAVGSPFGTGDELFGFNSSFKRRSAIIGDMLFTGPRRQWSRTVSRAGVKSYAYHYTHRDATTAAQPHLGVPHGAEVAYVYGLGDPGEEGMSTVMMDYWISFADSVDPNDGRGVKRPVWPQYTERDQVVLRLDGPGSLDVVKDDFREEQIAYLNENAFVLRR